MPSVDSARGGGGATVWRHQAAAPVAAPVVAAPGLGAAWHYSPLNFKLAVKPIGLTLYSSTASWSRAANSASSSSLVPVA